MKERITSLNCLALHSNDQNCAWQKEVLSACMDAQREVGCRAWFLGEECGGGVGCGRHLKPSRAPLEAQPPQCDGCVGSLLLRPGWLNLLWGFDKFAMNFLWDFDEAIVNFWGCLMKNFDEPTVARLLCRFAVFFFLFLLLLGGGGIKDEWQKEYLNEIEIRIDNHI